MEWVFFEGSWPRLRIQILLLPIRDFQLSVKFVSCQISAQRSHFLGMLFSYSISFLYSSFLESMHKLMMWQMPGFRDAQSLSASSIDCQVVDPVQVPRGCISLCEHARKTRSSMELMSPQHSAASLTNPPHEFQSSKIVEFSSVFYLPHNPKSLFLSFGGMFKFGMVML